MIIKIRKSKTDVILEKKAHDAGVPGDAFTRREFFERGLIGLSSYLAAPSALSLLLRSQTSFSATQDIRKVFILDFPGGAGFGSEVALLLPNGEIPTGMDYFKTGAPLNNFSVNRQFGAPIWSGGLLNQALTSSAPLTGMGLPTGNPVFPGSITNASEAVKQRLKIVVLQHSNSLDDVASNPTLATQAVANAAVVSQMNYKAKGGLQARSNTNFGTGGFARSSLEFTGLNPAITDEMAKLEKLFKLDQGALTALSPTQLVGVANASFSFSEAVKRTLGDQNQLVNRAVEGASNLRSLADNQPKLNLVVDFPVGNAERTFYNNHFRFEDPNLNQVQRERNLIMAGNVKAVLDGLAPLAVFSENDQIYDYHDGGTTWKTRHHPLMIDQTMKILNTMAAKNQSGILAWHTNGAILFDENQNAQGDGSSYHAGVLFILSSGSSSDPLPQSFYLGGSNMSGGGLNDINLNILARSPSYEGHALLANLLSLSKVPKSEFERFKPRNISLADFQALSVFRS